MMPNQISSRSDFGLSVRTVEDMRSIFARFPSVEQAVIYGSRARGDYRNGSDIDVALIGRQLSRGEAAQIVGEIEDSDIPYKVDVVILAELEHATLREHIDQVGKVFYAANRDLT